MILSLIAMACLFAFACEKNVKGSKKVVFLSYHCADKGLKIKNHRMSKMKDQAVGAF